MRKVDTPNKAISLWSLWGNCDDDNEPSVPRYWYVTRAPQRITFSWHRGANGIFFSFRGKSCESSWALKILIPKDKRGQSRDNKTRICESCRKGAANYQNRDQLGCRGHHLKARKAIRVDRFVEEEQNFCGEFESILEKVSDTITIVFRFWTRNKMCVNVSFVCP